MNTSDLLTQAASHLRQAALARKQEVDDLQRLITDKANQEKDRMNDLRQEEAQRLNEAADANDDYTTASRRQAASRVRDQESHLKHDFDKFKRDTDQLIKVKQRNVDDINKAAQSVERWAQM